MQARLERIEQIVISTAEQILLFAGQQARTDAKLSIIDTKLTAVAERQAAMETKLNAVAERQEATDARLVLMEAKLSTVVESQQRMEGRLSTLEEHVNWVMEWLNKKFITVDQEFATINKRFEEMRGYIELKHESILSDFRAFREMHTHLAHRVTILEAS